MFFKLLFIVTAELFVLTAAIFLLAYVTKQQLTKWFTYTAAGIIITTLMIMVFTMSSAICIKRCEMNSMRNECPFDDKKINHFDCNNSMMNDHKCCDRGMKDCEMKEKEIIITKDSMPKKEVIIKTK